MVDVFSIYLASHKKANFVPYNWFVLIETLLLYYFFNKTLLLTFTKRIVYFFSFCFPIIWFAYYRKLGTIGYVDTAVTYENISIIILTIFYFYEQINKAQSSVVYNQPSFWIVAAYLIYSAGTFFLFIYIDSLHRNDQQKYYVLNYLLLIFKFILLSIAMLMKNEPPARKNFQLT